MKSHRISFRSTGITGITLIILTTCACFSTSEKKASSAQELLNQGIKEVKLNSSTQAKAAFQQVIEDFPDSKQRVKALLLLGRTYYSDTEYEEAKFHFQKFLDLYPMHKQADRAQFFKAMSDFKMIDIASRDQTHTQEALENFNKLIDRFPKSQFLKDARKKAKECELKLAQNILEIGKFYYRTGSYQSAINRLKNLINKYPHQNYLEEAIFLIAESYYHEQNFSQASISYRKLLKNYPKTKFRQEVRNRLKALQKKLTL